MQFWCRMVLASTLLAAAAPAAAQQTMGDASLSGQVIDPTGAPVAGADVTVRHVPTQVAASVVSDQQGRFRFAYLKVGPYALVVSHPGFAPTTRPLVLTVGSAFDIPVRLALEGVASTVTVTAEPPVLESARSQVAVTMSEQEVRQLPLNGRNFLDIALLAPAVAPPNINSTQVFAETSAVPGVGLSVSSQRNLSNSFVVDGLSANDDAAGLAGMPYSVDAIEQFQVISSGGQAEFGRALGGYVNVVTRSGTSQRRGTVYGYLRDDRFNAANPLSGTTLPMSQRQVGGSLGGPVVGGRTFFFANAEQRALDQTGVTTISADHVATINARLAAVGYPGTPVTTGLFDTPVDTWNVLGKVDHRLNARDHLTLRYSLHDVAAMNVRGGGGLASSSASAGLDNRDHAVALANTLTIGSRTVNETRAQFTHSELRALSSDPIGPAVSIAGVATFGTFSSSPQGRFNRMIQVVNNLSQQRGSHALRAGIDVVHNDDRISFPRAVRGSYAFASMAAFLDGTYNGAGFTQTFGATDVSQAATNLGLYLQDAWTLSPSFTVNLGLRYDLQFLQTVETDADNLSPRVGFAWTPLPSQSLVVRGSAGRYVDRVPLRALANALLSAGNSTDLGLLRQTTVSLSPGQANAPAFPDVLAAPVSTVTLANLTTMQRDLQSASSIQASVELEQRLGGSGTISVGYSYLSASGLLMAINQNVPSCVPSGLNNGCRAIAAYGNDSRYSSAGDSTYHALIVTLTQRPVRWGYYRAAYTLSSAMNNVGEFFFSGPLDPLDLSKDWARADNDRRHLFVFSGGLLSHGFQLSSMVQAYSAAPFNITSGVTTVQGTAGRPVVDGAFIPRNAGAGDAFFTVSARLSRSFTLGGGVQLEALAEIFNLLDTVNDTARNTTFGTGAFPTNPSTSFGQVTAVGDPRSAQFALRLRF